MNRRRFIAQAGVAATTAIAARPLPVAAQQPALPVIGFLGGTAPIPEVVAPFKQGLAEAGFVDGLNVTIAYRWAHNQPERLPALAAELLRMEAAVIAINGGAVVARAAKAATATVPIVFLVGADPVATGLVESLARPGGNATGVYMLTGALNGKRLPLLHEMVPRARTMAALVNPANPDVQAIEREIRAAALAAGVQLQLLHSGTEREVDAAFATLADKRIGALVLSNSPFFNSRREQLVTLATRHELPAIFEWRDFAVRGGLMSYGSDITGALREFGVDVARVLKGARAADLPVLQPTRYELVINGNTARRLGLTIPQALRLSANEVIE